MNETTIEEYVFHLAQDRELFRLASLCGCEPQSEVKHRYQLAEYVAGLMAAVVSDYTEKDETK